MTRSPWPDERTITAARAGDEASIAELVAGSHPHVRRFAFSLCASRQDAEDATQEAMIILYQRIGTLRFVAALSSWLFRIVSHECLRRARAALRLEPSIDDRTVPSAEEEALGRRQLDDIIAAIAKLPPDQRAVLVLRDVRNLPGAEVADLLGISPAAMKSRLHRARSALRDDLAHHHRLDDAPERATPDSRPHRRRG